MAKFTNKSRSEVEADLVLNKDMVASTPAPSTPSPDKTSRAESKFTGGVAAHYFIGVLSALACYFTLGLLTPVMMCWRQRWLAKHTYINGRRLTFDGSASELFGKFIIWWLLSVVTFGLYYIIVVDVSLQKWIARHTHFEDNGTPASSAENKSYFDGKAGHLFGIKLLTKFVTSITLGIAYPWAACCMEDWMTRHTVIDGQRFRFDAQVGQLFRKYILWFLLTVVTLGVYSLWLAIKYKQWAVSHTEALDTDDIGQTGLSVIAQFGRGLRAQGGWLFVAPALLLMAIFTFYPIFAAFINAFKQEYNGITGYYSGWGFGNFVHVIKGDNNSGGADFTQCLVNTLVFTFISVPVSTLLALLISVALNSIKAVQKAYQTILFLPYLTNALAMGAVFATFFTVIGTKSQTDTVGIINLILGLRDNPIYWTSKALSPTWEIGRLTIPWAKYVVLMVYEVWSGLPFKILILFSALQSINKQYYDAAKVDGASRWTILWRITAPMVSPQISYLLVTGIMGGMKQYSAVVGIFGAQMGLNYDMGTMVGYIYNYINSDKTGYAFAGSLLLFIIIMIITFINNKVTKKHTTYR